MIDTRISAALLEIYDTAVNPGRWRHALDRVADAVEAKALALVIRGPESRPRDLTLLNSTYLDFSRTAAGMYYGLWLSRHQKADWDFLSRQKAQEPIPDTAMGRNTEQLDRRADYAFLRRRLDVARRLGVRLNDDRLWFDAISIGFETNRNPIPPGAAGLLRPILPHLTKSVEIGRAFTRLKARYKAVLAALDHVRVGLGVALPSGELIVWNAEMKRIFDLEDGLALGGDNRLAIPDPDRSAAMAAHCAAAAATAAGEGSQAEILEILPRRSGKTSFLVDIAPLRDSAAELDGPLEGALVTVIDPDHVTPLRLTRFARLHGLTAAETEVCTLLAEGCSIPEIAERRGTAEVTAKNQVAAVLTKTGASRRVELIRLVIRVLPPID